MNNHPSSVAQYRRIRWAVLIAILVVGRTPAAAQAPASSSYEFNDSHFHLTNYIQEGTGIRDFLNIMGTRVGRVALFGIPLQQQWSYRADGDTAPKYYLETDAPLYYYSFTDAYIAMAYRSLSKQEQNRFDPMITGFNPTDMYAADHIRRVLMTFPGVFSGIGEFTIHKEFVSAKIAGEVASLQDPALDRILDFASEVGLVVLIHNDIDTPFSKSQSDASAVTNDKQLKYLTQVKALFKRHSAATIIWAHVGMGRIVRPVKGQAAIIEAMLKDPVFNHVCFDISWDQVAKYLVATRETTQVAADLINRYPNRFLFGTDEVAPSDQVKYLKVYSQYRPLWDSLSKEACQKVLKGNYERIFDEARRKVRVWEDTHVSGTKPQQAKGSTSPARYLGK